MELARILLEAPSPFADPVVRLDLEVAPPPDVAAVHSSVRLAIAEAITVVQRDRRAQMVLVTGDPGMGKTHQLAHLRRRSEGMYVCVDVPPLKDTSPFGHIARYMVQGLAAAGVLERLLWDVLRQVAVAVRADADEHGDDDVVARIDDALVGSDRFAMAFRSLAQQDPELGPLLYKRGRRLAPLSTLPADFGRVLGCITDREAERAIVDWLRAAELAEEDLALLGLEHGVDTEARAFEVVRALCLCSQRPVVMCLDQLESIAGLIGAGGVARMFTALMELYQQVPVAIVLMCQTQQWVELRRDVPQAAVDRIRVLPPLAKPTADEALAIVASRLDAVWTPHGVRPSYATWPFPADAIRAIVEERRPTIRGLLLEIDAHFVAMRRSGVVAELGLSVEMGPAEEPAPGPAPKLEPPPVDEKAALRAARDRYRRAADERRELATPAFREELLRHAVLDILEHAWQKNAAIGGVKIASVENPEKPKVGPRPPAIVILETDDGARRLAIDVHSSEPRSTHRVLARLRDLVDDQTADCAVLLREREAPLPESAKRSHELLDELGQRGGALIWIEEEDALRLVGAELLLDAASAAEVLVGTRNASREEVLTFLFEDDGFSELLRPIISRASASRSAA
ncbi:MAG TPA: hypothetical protein VM261_06995 [Kofleriaceae bacterium]|nr:hypothetical protein [Kofleriaceae bacterium]